MYERRPIVQLHRYPFIRENVGRASIGGFCTLNIICQWENSNLITANISIHMCVVQSVQLWTCIWVYVFVYWQSKSVNSNWQYLLRRKTTDSQHTTICHKSSHNLKLCIFEHLILALWWASNQILITLQTNEWYFGSPSQKIYCFTFSPGNSGWLFGVSW